MSHRLALTPSRRRQATTADGTTGSGDEQHLPRRPPTLERAVRLGGPVERQLELHPEPELAILDPAEQLAGTRDELVARRDVVEEARAGEKQRPLLAEKLGIDGRGGPARLA